MLCSAVTAYRIRFE
ncbi:hypothetical protein PC112_g15831, partial [Phytophthora cactorum]